MMRVPVLLASALALTSCSLPGLGGGSDLPATLTTLDSNLPAAAPDLTRSEAVSYAMPILPEALSTVRVAAIQGGTAVAYIEDLRLVDTPSALFQQLLSETTYRSTDLLVIDPRLTDAAPALNVSGRLYRFDFDVDTQQVVVGYEALWRRGETVATRRFEAREPATGYAPDVAPALNAAANRVAQDVAAWIDG